MWIEFGEIKTNWLAAVSPTAAQLPCLPPTNQKAVFTEIFELWLFDNQIMSVREFENASVSLFYSLACCVFESQYFKGQVQKQLPYVMNANLMAAQAACGISFFWSL